MITDYTVELFYRLEDMGQLYDYITIRHFATAALARDFRLNAIRTTGQWPPKGAQDIEVGEIRGPDIAYTWPTREKYLAGLAQAHEALAACSGPLVKSLAKSLVGSRRQPVSP